MKDILHHIIKTKQAEIATQKKPLFATLTDDCLERMPLSLKQSIVNSESCIIAEFKRRSPSRDWINRLAKANVIPSAYEKAGAAALSILTDERFFGGSIADMIVARAHVNIPLLRKDFIIHPSQIFEARAIGADAILLIAAVLSEQQCAELTEVAHSLGLEVLLEIHKEEELRYITPLTDLVGVNNRCLDTFITDVNNSVKLAGMLPVDKVKIAESGISNPETVRMLKEHGFNGFLMGECFMSSADPAQKLTHFIHDLSLLTC